VRNPSKVPEEVKSHPNVTIIEGQLNDKEGLEKAVSSGATVFASFAGPTYGSKGTPVTECMKLLFPLLIEKAFKRALVLGTPSFSAPEDKGGFKWRASILLVKLIGGSGYLEFHGLGEFVNGQDAVCSLLYFSLHLDCWGVYKASPLSMFWLSVLMESCGKKFRKRLMKADQDPVDPLPSGILGQWSSETSHSQLYGKWTGRNTDH
jgi:hypothetical protein